MAAAAAGATPVIVYEGLDTVRGRDADLDTRFLLWCKEKGILAPKLEYPFFNQDGIRGLGATCDLVDGEPLVQVPEDMLLTPSVAKRDPVVGHIFAADDILFDDADVLLGSYLAYQRSLGEGSMYAPWIAVMPSHIECLPAWSAAELAALQDSSLELEAKERRDSLADTANTLTAELLRRYPDCLNAATFTPEVVAWGIQTVSARAYGRRLREAALVPMADAFNHGSARVKYGMARLTPRAEAAAEGEGRAGEARATASAEKSDATDSKRVDAAASDDAEAEREFPAPGTRVFRIWPSNGQRYAAGQEVHNSYGRRDNKHLALEYGFATLDNEWDAVLLRPGGVGDVGRLAAVSVASVGGSHGKGPGGSSASAQLLTPAKRTLLLRLGIAAPHVYARGNAWCGAQLLPFFRVLACTAAEEKPLAAACPATPAAAASAPAGDSAEVDPDDHDSALCKRLVRRARAVRHAGCNRDAVGGCTECAADASAASQHRPRWTGPPDSDQESGSEDSECDDDACVGSPGHSHERKAKAPIPGGPAARMLGLANELRALQLAEAYLETVLRFATTSIEEDEAALSGRAVAAEADSGSDAEEPEGAVASGEAISYRQRVALTYRLTRKRIIRQQIDTTSAMTRVVELQLQRLQRIHTASVPAHYLVDPVGDYVSAVGDTLLAEALHRLGLGGGQAGPTVAEAEADTACKGLGGKAGRTERALAAICELRRHHLTCCDPAHAGLPSAADAGRPLAAQTLVLPGERLGAARASAPLSTAGAGPAKGGSKAKKGGAKRKGGS
jgi:hypothetical protein